MKAIITTVICMLTVIYSLPVQSCKGSFFEMNLKRDSICTPGNMHLTMKLTNRVKIEDQYQFKVSIYMAGTLIRQKTLAVIKNQSVTFELAFPEVFAKTDGRCRSELFIDGYFIEAHERPLTLYPPVTPYTGESIKSKEIWTFDISGQIQELFADIEVKVTDATFQSARDFSTPDIVFIGQDIDSNSMQLITNRLKTIEPKPVTIFLRQKQFIKETKIEIPTENNFSQKVDCDFNSPLLDGLNTLDVMNMVDDASYIKIKKQEGKDWSVESCVTEVVEDEKNIYTYLCMIKNEGQITIYCQLRLYDGDDPRYDILLKSLIKYADKVSDSKKQ